MTVELPMHQLELLADMIAARIKGNSPSPAMIHILAGDDLETAMDAREKELRNNRRGRK